MPIKCKKGKHVLINDKLNMGAICTLCGETGLDCEDGEFK